MTDTRAIPDFDFSSATVPDYFQPDSVPPLADVEYPCEVCGAEAGPYGGRGRKPTKCTMHKKGSSKSSAVKVTGSAATLAAQAAKSLSNMNSMMAVLAAGIGLFGTGGAILEANTSFEEQAFNALLTDSELCKTILKTSGKSAGLGLIVAYGGMAVAVAPVAVMEIKDKKAARAARLEAEDEAGA